MNKITMYFSDDHGYCLVPEKGMASAWFRCKYDGLMALSLMISFEPGETIDKSPSNALAILEQLKHLETPFFNEEQPSHEVNVAVYHTLFNHAVVQCQKWKLCMEVECTEIPRWWVNERGTRVALVVITGSVTEDCSKEAAIRTLKTAKRQFQLNDLLYRFLAREIMELPNLVENITPNTESYEKIKDFNSQLN